MSLGLQALHSQAWKPIALEDKPSTSSQSENSNQNKWMQFKYLPINKAGTD